LKILAIAPFLCTRNAASGGSTQTRAQFERLRNHHDVSLVALCDHADPDLLRADVDELSGVLAQVTAVPNRPSRRTRWAGRLAIALGWPSAPVSYRSAAMRDAISAEIRRFQPDVALIQFPEMAQYVDALGDVPAVMDVQDAYSVSKFRRAVTASGGLRKIFATLQWLAWVRYERHYYARFQAVLAATEQDRYGLLIFDPDLNVITQPRVLKGPSGARAPETPDRIGFVASFSHAPNIEAIRYFAEDILPLIQAKSPGARFVVTGRNPPRDLIEAYAGKVDFAGFVEDVYAFNQSCAVMVAPLKSGGGVKLKTIEALIAGASVVSTPIGAEEIGAEDGVHMFVRSTAEGFADAVTTLLSDAPLRRRMQDAAQSFAAERFIAGDRDPPLEAALATAVTGERRKAERRGV